MSNRDLILEKVDIVDHISKFTELKRQGNSYRGLCPLHGDKHNPGLSVNREKQFFHCFVCGKGGDVISFVAHQKNIEYRTAMELIAADYGIELKKFSRGDYEKENKKLEANKVAAKFYVENIGKTPNAAHSYMEKRKISEKTMRRFGIGYASEDRTELFRYARDRVEDIKPFFETGLLLDKNGDRVDRYNYRVMFPIINIRKEVIGFGGRTLSDKPNLPKYINSQESDVFHKRSNLYALNLTREEIMQAGEAILVEGYMDVIGLYQFGVKNVTASLGTALTPEQARLLSKWTKKVIIAYDSDDAGVAAANKAGEILHGAGLKTKVVSFKYSGNTEEPYPKDPDEYIIRYGEDTFRKEIDGAMHYVEFRLKVAKEKYDLNDRDHLFAYIDEVTPVLRALKPVERNYYIELVAEGTGIIKSVIEEQLAQGKSETARAYVEPHIGTGHDSDKKKNIEESVSRAEAEMIKILLQDIKLIERIEDTENLHFSDWVRNLIERWQKVFAENSEEDFYTKGNDKLYEGLAGEEAELLKKIEESPKLEIAAKREKQFGDLLLSAEISKLETDKERKKEMLQYDLPDYTEDERQQFTKTILADIDIIEKKIRELKRRK